MELHQLLLHHATAHVKCSNYSFIWIKKTTQKNCPAQKCAFSDKGAFPEGTVSTISQETALCEGIIAILGVDISTSSCIPGDGICTSGGLTFSVQADFLCNFVSFHRPRQ
jgi:hypothetical protein